MANKKKTRIVFITRDKAKNKAALNDKNGKMKRLVTTVRNYGIEDRYIIADFKDLNCKVDGVEVKVFDEENPTGPISMNGVLKGLAKKPFAFLVCSKEVNINGWHLKKMVDELESDENLLVVGVRLKINNEKLNKELQNYYNNEKLVAYQVPWNTCAVWNYELFNKYVCKFDEITMGRYPFAQIFVTIDGQGFLTNHQGMEDGLAIAQAASQLTGKKKIYRLLDLHDESPIWEIDTDEEEAHRQKLSRKETVLRNFMAVRNYSIVDLLNAKK